MRDAIIIDIDGTLSDPSHRLYHLDTNDWKSFFDKCHLDSPLATVNLARILHRNDMPAILLVSGRPDSHMHQTRGWLALQGVRYEGLYMRRAGDFRPDVVVKKEILDQLHSLGYNILLAIDDREEVCRMWQNNYIPVMQLKTTTHATRSYAKLGSTMLYLMVGPVCAGKSTYVKNGEFRGDCPGAIVIASDEFRLAITGDEDAQTHNKQVFTTMHNTAKALMNGGVPVVYDATNVRSKDRKSAAALTPEGCRCQYIVLDRPLKTKLEERGRRSEELVKRYHDIFHANRADILRGDDLPYVDVLDARQKEHDNALERSEEQRMGTVVGVAHG